MQHDVKNRLHLLFNKTEILRRIDEWTSKYPGNPLARAHQEECNNQPLPSERGVQVPKARFILAGDAH